MIWQSARFYDSIYARKDYAAEAAHVVEVAKERIRSKGRRLLDVACGTGGHLAYLKSQFKADGLDLSPDLLDIARKKHPELGFHQDDMADFDLGVQYDILTCLFSSIGYLKTIEEVSGAAACCYRHTLPGGVLLVEPWFTPDQWYPGTVHALFIDKPDIKIARINTSHRVGSLSVFDLHYLVGTAQQTEHFVEHHEMGLFETHELQAAFEAAGFDVEYDAQGLNRGLLICSRPVDGESRSQ